MSIRRENISTISLITMLVIFVGTVIAVQLTTVYMSAGWLFILYMIYLLRPVSRGVRDVSLLSMLYLLGYWLCMYLSVFIKEYLNLVDFPREFIIASSRLSLIGFIIPFLVFRIINKSTTDYLKKGSFTETIYFPLIWKGVKDPIWRFLLIPWSVCALFSIFGMVLGGITIRSKGLFPVMILHFIMNMLFVFSGLIFNM
ncbi:hypothetical protein PMSD_24530 [Paenibacillus macquariensis subsp. defensor]|nr:hypothetical protein PMSD_24530 [Paenibacillus macquariensis subsp. defensor]